LSSFFGDMLRSVLLPERDERVNPLAGADFPGPYQAITLTGSILPHTEPKCFFTYKKWPEIFDYLQAQHFLCRLLRFCWF
jgi:hypothetical protein